MSDDPEKQREKKGTPYIRDKGRVDGSTLFLHLAKGDKPEVKEVKNRSCTEANVGGDSADGTWRTKSRSLTTLADTAHKPVTMKF